MTRKILLGGSPCTHWSIAQTKNRETKPEGLGWELFRNYLIAREKYKPDYFLYENNKSMSAAIREQITRKLGVEPILINSAQVSAQNRQRLYWTNIPNAVQPEDRGILLRDILGSGLPMREKAYTLKASMGHQNGPSNILRCIQTNGHFSANGAAEPVRIGTIESDAKNAGFDSRQYRVYSPDGKSVTLCGQGGRVGARTGLYAIPCAGRIVGRRINEEGHRDDYNEEIPHFQRFEVNENNQKTNCLTTVQKDNMIAVPVEYYETPNGLEIRVEDGGKYPIYEVLNGQITIKGKRYPIKLADGFYIIRKLTVRECMRLQTVPEDYIFPVSDTQAYKMLGNGWTVDVIAHILSFCPGIETEPVEVLSMYDGMSCGRLALNKLGANVVRYYATEIDKYAVQTTQHNFPDTIQLGDAFQVRDDGWSLPGLNAEETVATLAEEAVEEPAGIPQGRDQGAEQRKTVDVPLTMEELEKMDGQPVWIDNGHGRNKCYIVNNEYEIHGTVEPCGIDLWGAGTSLSLLVRCGLYRNPPNREASA